MNEIGRGTLMEICDTVYENVMDEIKENLSFIKPQLVDEIVDIVLKRVEERIINRIDRLERILEELETARETNDIYWTDNNNYESVPAKPEIEIPYDAFRYNGWVYYANEKMGDCLYKVKEDGTCNTQLTDYSVNPFSMKVSHGYLHFQDTNYYNDHKIKID